MIKSQKGETWKPVKFKKGLNPRNKYAVSNFGRIASFEKNPKDGNLLNGTTLGGYIALSIRNSTIAQTCYVHKLVAQSFIKKSNPGQKFVIHLDHDKANNHFKNLKWANYSDIGKNISENPERKKRLMIKPSNSKLTPAKVRNIKSLLAKGRRAEELATKFDISKMQIYRIKRGEVWSTVE